MRVHWSIPLFLIAVAGSSAHGKDPVDRTHELEEISTDFELCDGPSWDGKGTLYLPDVKGEKLYTYQPQPNRLLSVALSDAGRISATDFQHGRLYLSDNGASSISWLNGQEKTLIVANPADAKPPQRPNDLVVDRAGGIYYTLTSTNQVMYVSPQGTQSVAVESIETPNGVALSPDEKTLYVSAYAPKTIWAYPIAATGKTGTGRQFAAMDDGPDKGADGMCVDADGNVYCAGARDVWVWSPDGKLLGKITPPTRPINCVFGDDDLKSLYITCFGGLYKQRMNVAGVPVRAMAAP